jgi:hypothetical protein
VAEQAAEELQVVFDRQGTVRCKSRPWRYGAAHYLRYLAHIRGRWQNAACHVCLVQLKLRVRWLRLSAVMPMPCI